VTGVTVCVIPALNVESFVGVVIHGLRQSLPGAVIVGVDDGSSDATASVLREACDRVLLFTQNRGKGAALRAGIAEALSLGGDAILSLDADGQHDPAYAPALVAALDSADIVVGARRRHATEMPMRRRVTNALSVAAARRLAGCDLPDPQSGFRAMRATVARSVDARGDRYEFETDFLLRAARAGFRVAAVPVPTIYGPPSHFREMRDGLRVVAMFCRHAWGGAAE
jgi:glycosyltransferase involved in cell wall biosynthesis